MYVSDILKAKGTSVVSIDVRASVVDALDLLNKHKIGAVVVLDGPDKIAGILSERDLVRSMHRLGREIFDRKVSDLMTAPVCTCGPNDPVAAIEGMMTANRFRHVPVVEGNRIVGIISIGDVVKNRIELAEAEVEALRRYISL